MAIDIKQTMKLQQQLIMTPQLQQAIKLLQLSRMELVELIKQEMEENPVLEEGVENEEREEVEAEHIEGAESGSSGDGGMETDWESYIERLFQDAPNEEMGFYEVVERPPIENVISKSPSLTEHLLEQLRLSKMSEEEKRIGVFIIGSLDENGYLRATVDEIAEMSGKGKELVEEVLMKIQQFDPPGIAARDLRECLLRQIEARGWKGSIMEKIVSDHLDLLREKDYKMLSKVLGISISEVANAVKAISELEPKPGMTYSSENATYIVPDAYVYKMDDEYVVVLNDDGLPKLRISPFYKQILSRSENLKGPLKEYIQEKVKNALWLIKSIHQRQRTLYKVVKSIVKFQRDFLDKGIEYMKPLILKDVADDINMHESTVSRATANKYIATPRGIFELKFFFTSGVSKSDGEGVSPEFVKKRIKEIVDAEDPTKPLSDREIADILKKEHIEIARRTVAKYREMMGISSSSRRKRSSLLRLDDS